MSRVAREKFKSGFFHIIIQGINKEYIFKTEENKKQFMFFMKKYYHEYQIKIIAYCIMDNHAHFIIYSEDINQISAYMHKINAIYAIDYNKKNNRVGYVFRDRYKSQYIYDRDYLLKCIKYIHLNPVKAKMVKKEEDYKYSSYQDFVNKQGYIDDFIIKLIFLDDDYITLFNGIDDVDIEILDVENNNINFENAIRNYLKTNNLTIKEIISNKEILHNFTSELVSKGYKQKQIADKLKISSSQISKIIKNKNYPQS